MPWSLILTAAVLVAFWALITRHSRKKEAVQRGQVAAVEATFVSISRSIQNQHQRKFGRASTDLANIESSVDDSTRS